MILIFLQNFRINWDINLFLNLQVRNPSYVLPVGSLLEIPQLWANTRSLCITPNALWAVKFVGKHSTTQATSEFICVNTQERDHTLVISVEKLLLILTVLKNTHSHTQIIDSFNVVCVVVDFGGVKAWSNIQKLTNNRRKNFMGTKQKGSNGSNMKVQKKLEMGDIIHTLNQWKCQPL